MYPDVTVVIPTKNRRAFLRRALGTALRQKQVNVEVIVVDDGSEDNTAQDVLRCAHLGVRLIRHERSRGVSAARNEGIVAAAAPWVAFLDDDDLWAPDKLAAQLARARQPRADGSTASWLSSGAVLVDEQDRVTGWASTGADKVDAAALLVNGVIAGGGSTILARKEALQRAGGFDERATLYEDWDMWIRMALQNGPVLSIDRPLAAYRIWSSASSRVEELPEAWREITRRYASEATRLGVAADVAALHRYRAYRSLQHEQYGLAADAYRDLARANGSRKALAMSLVVSRAGSQCRSVMALRSRRRVPSGVRAEAEAWLTDVDTDARRWVGDLEPVS